jgi:hypothetical protein
MPPKRSQVNGNHTPAAVTGQSSPRTENPTSKKRTAASLDPPRPSKQRRVSEEDARVESPSVLPDSTPELRKSRKSKPTPTQRAPPDEDDDNDNDEQTTLRSKRARGKKVATGSFAQEVAVTVSPKKIKKTKATIVKEEEEIDIVESPRGSRNFKKTETAVLVEEEEIEIAESPKRSRKVKKSEAAAVLKEEDVEAAEETPKKVKRHRKTKEEKEAEAMPLAARTNGLRMFIGAHVSAAKGE